MIERIDEWLINHIYQPIIDWSQRDGAWWIQQMCTAAVIFDLVCVLSLIMEMGIEKRSFFSLGIQIACAVYFVIWARSKVRVAMIGTARWFRKFFLVLLPFIMIADVFKFPLNIPVDLVFMSIYFFAACRPPKPREKRETKPKLVFNN
jgi:hypothetical protein